MAEDSLKGKTAKGIAWSAVDRFSAQGIQFVFNILIARILLPEDYGAVAMLNIFIAIANTFIDSGFTRALIRKKDRTQVDYSTVFFFNIAVSTLFCMILWLAAPLIASFYDIPILTKITRVFSLTLIINSFGAIQGTHLTIELNFRKKAIISIATISAVGSIGLFLASKGFGVWTLVGQCIVSSVVSVSLLWCLSGWRPSLAFSWTSLKEMFGFGSKLLVSSLIDALYNNIYTIVIGKVYNPSSLGVYNRAESFASFPSSNFYGIINSVSFPVLCSIQDQRERLRSSFRQFIRLSAYLVFPMMVGLAVVCDPFINTILNENWQESVPLLRILCFALVLYPFDALNLSFPNILGRSDWYLKVLIINKVVDVLVLVVTIPMGLTALCWGRVVGYGICFFVNTYYTNKLIDYGPLRQLKDMLPIILQSAAMGGLVFLVTRPIQSNPVKLLVGIAVGAVFYLLVSILTKSEEYHYIKDLIMSRLGNGRS